MLEPVTVTRHLLLSSMETILGRRARAADTWLANAASAATRPETFAAAFASASRHAGRSALALTSEEVDELRPAGVTWSIARWALDDFARAALLVRAAQSMNAPTLQAVTDHCYRIGDTRERQGILRALALLPYPDRFLALAIEAARSGVVPLFEAVAGENPYPALHFPALSFNHLVLSALVNGVALERIIGLSGRVTPQLVRMANEWAAERRSASRRIPADLSYLTTAAHTAA